MLRDKKNEHIAGNGKSGKKVKGLESWIFEAYRTYQKEVMTGEKSYGKYSQHYVDGHLYTDHQDAESKNLHNKNYNIMRGLLLERQQLVERYFRKEKFSDSDCKELIHTYNTTESDAELARGGKTLFYHTLTERQIAVVHEYMVRMRLFKSKPTLEEVQELFSCKLQKPLVSANNRTLAQFFHTLEMAHLITDRWKWVIECHKMMVSSSGKVLTQTAIVAALWGGRTPKRSHEMMRDEDNQQLLEEMKRVLKSEGET